MDTVKENQSWTVVKTDLNQELLQTGTGGLSMELGSVAKTTVKVEIYSQGGGCRGQWMEIPKKRHQRKGDSCWKQLDRILAKGRPGRPDITGQGSL